MEAQQPLLHEVLRNILRSMSFPVNFKTAVDNGDGTITLGGIKEIHHLQPDTTVTIGLPIDQDFVIQDYYEGDCYWNVKLKKENNVLPTAPGIFYVKKPFFFHGTPAQQQTEFTKFNLPKDKMPMLYLMEPHDPEIDKSFDSSIDSRHKVVLCFLTEGKLTQWSTDESYHNAIHPMNRLFREFIEALKNSNLFYTDRLKARPKYHTKFAIWVTRPKTQELLFAENAAGVSVELYLELYRFDSCCCPIVYPANNVGDYNSDFSDAFFN